MKIKNLLLVPLLSAALVATSCSLPGGNGDSGSTSDSSDTSAPASKTVSRITVQSPSSAVVGDEIDFDTIVEVIYDDNSKDKDYSLEAQAASASLVSIDGHKVKFLGEGSVNINVKAGGQSAKFSTSVYTKERAALKNYFDNFPATYGVQLQEYDEGKNIVDKPGAKIVHQGDYYGHYYFNSSDPKAGGYLCAADGNVYKWKASDMDGADFEAVPGPQKPVSEWDLYFINTPLYFNLDDYKVVNDESGNFACFAIDQSAAARSDLLDYFKCQIDELMYCACSYDFEEDTEKVLNVFLDENPAGGYDFHFELIYKSADDGEIYGFPFRFDFSNSFNKVQPVEDYIASGEHPEAVDFSQLSDATGALVTAQNYTVTYETYFANPSTGAEVDYVTGLNYLAYVFFEAPGLNYGWFVESYDFGFVKRDETVYVTANGTYHEESVTTFFNPSTHTAYDTPVVSTDISGLIKHNDVINNYAKLNGETSYVHEATTSTELWGGDFSNQLANALVPGTDFIASGNERDDDKGWNEIGFASSVNKKYFGNTLNQTVSGPKFNSAFADVWKEGTDYLGYFDVTAYVKDDGTITYSSYIYLDPSLPLFCIDVSISDIGTTELPAGLEAEIFGS